VKWLGVRKNNHEGGSSGKAKQRATTGSRFVNITRLKKRRGRRRRRRRRRRGHRF
jgi:hypothetical protein